jgi:hypothetical protein
MNAAFSGSTSLPELETDLAHAATRDVFREDELNGLPALVHIPATPTKGARTLCNIYGVR